MEEREENDGAEVDGAEISADATGDCMTEEVVIVDGDMGDIGNIGAVGDIFGASADVSVDSNAVGDAGDDGSVGSVGSVSSGGVDIALFI
jgi:hypothetical protein